MQYKNDALVFTRIFYFFRITSLALLFPMSPLIQMWTNKIQAAMKLRKKDNNAFQ
jgi:hypothetical protein